jgi:hypothetical protein
MKVLDDGRRLEFDPDSGFFGFPGAPAEFTIRHDPVTGQYLAIVNNLADVDVLTAFVEAPSGPNTAQHQKYRMRQRSVASLSASPDLWHWWVVKPLLGTTSGLTKEDAIRLTGYQYTHWHFDGDDLIFVVRVADRGANNFHDANQINFYRLRDFRRLLAQDA